jgi:purine-nucleoside phosphorylase
VALPDFQLTAALARAAASHDAVVHVGPVVTVDVEPHLSATTTRRWREHGLLAVEMESAALFYLALRANALGDHHVRAACILTVSDGLDGHPDGAQRFMSDRELSVATDVMHAVALEALTASEL